MRKNRIYILTVFTATFLLTMPVFSSSLNSRISTVGEVRDPARGTFQMHGASVTLNCFIPQARNFQPRAWEIIKDLGINVLHVGGGTEGDIAHLNIRNYPNDWAQNLDAFLSEADNHGVKVYFSHLGSGYYTLFGIVSPGAFGPAPATPIDEAKAMIDKLAGDNPLKHNFITDPRVIGWRTSCEDDISDPAVLSWNLELCDYIRSKGGKVWIASPSYGSGSDYFDFALTEPLLRGHVDYLEAHYYDEWELMNRYNKDFNAFYTYYKNMLINKMVNVRGNYSIDQLILGEFGIWRGYTDGMGVIANFTDDDRRNYYQAVLDAARDAGIKNVLFFSLLAEKYPDGTYEIPNWGVVDVDGTYYPLVTDIIRNAYASI